jgi:hypothetical protein
MVGSGRDGLCSVICLACCLHCCQHFLCICELSDSCPSLLSLKLFQTCTAAFAMSIDLFLMSMHKFRGWSIIYYKNRRLDACAPPMSAGQG